MREVPSPPRLSQFSLPRPFSITAIACTLDRDRLNRTRRKVAIPMPSVLFDPARTAPDTPPRRFRTLLPVLWFLAIAAGSFLPFSWKFRLHTTGPLHLPLHFLAFLVAGLLACIACRTLRRRAFLCAAILACAGVIELLQAGIFHNRLEWLDLLADSAGVALALLSAAVIRYPE
jgi:hypothetical protein